MLAGTPAPHRLAEFAEARSARAPPAALQACWTNVNTPAELARRCRPPAHPVRIDLPKEPHACVRSRAGGAGPRSGIHLPPHAAGGLRALYRALRRKNACKTRWAWAASRAAW
ncbi:MAG: hypothetical protein U1A27_03530 [Phycisphaerae bacterium]